MLGKGKVRSLKEWAWGTYRKSKEERRFTDAGVSDKKHFEEVVTRDRGERDIDLLTIRGSSFG